MNNSNFNRYEQILVNAFAAVKAEIIRNEPLIDFERVQIECARLLLIDASKTKKAPRRWVCDTFGVSLKWLHRKNL